MKYLYIILLSILLISCQAQKKLLNDDLYKLSDPINYSDFQVTYLVYYGIFDDSITYFSSFDSLYSKQNADGMKSTKLYLTIKDKRKLYKLIKKADIFNIPDILVEDKGARFPNFPVKIKFQIGQLKKSIYYSGFGGIKDKDIEKKFNKISKEIRKRITNKDEYKKMPKNNMMYR